MKNKDITLTLDFFHQHLKEIDKKFMSKVLLDQNRIMELASSKGTLQSGMTISNLMKGLHEELDSRMKDSLQLITEYQKEMNLRLNEEALSEIEHEYKDFYTNLYQSAFKTIEDRAVNLVGEPTGVNITNSTIKHSKIHEISRTIESKIKEIDIKNKVKKDEPSLIVSKKALRNSKIALVVSIITAALTIYRLFFY